ncbi:HP1117 family Sel1-like repeat protein [Helicobacter pylori]
MFVGSRTHAVSFLRSVAIDIMFDLINNRGATMGYASKLALKICLVGLCLFSALGAEHLEEKRNYIYKGEEAYNNKEYERAASFYKSAIKNGEPLAYVLLGIMYENGRGVPKDYKKAAEYFQKAVDNDIPRGYNNLGVMYKEGRGVPKDEKKAVEYFRIATEKGYTNAYINLGIMYMEGRGVSSNYVKATECFRKAMHKGNVEAYILLGDIYYGGNDQLGIEPDKDKAVVYYKMAADMSSSRAYEGLSESYRYGLGVEKDKQKAEEYIQKACDFDIDKNCKKKNTSSR